MPERTKVDARRVARVWWSLIVASCATCGCGSDPEVGDGCFLDLNCTMPPAWRCEGDSMPVRADESRGVFVSASLGDDAQPGTPEQPVRTFHQALTLAEKGRRLVYACAEEFTEAVTVSSDVEIWGGFDCSDGWRDVHGNRRTTLRADPGSIPLQVAAFVATTVLVADLRIEASNATSPGGSSIAMLAAKRSTVEMCRGELIAGNGMDGAPGEDAPLEAAQTGRPGNPGVDACLKDPTPGGAPVATGCGDIETIGGIGGDGNAAFGSNGYDGTPVPVPNPDGWGVGGAGEIVDAQCDDGERGKNGDDGGNEPGVSGLGVLVPSGWEGIRGKDGHGGMPGHGGGGGGGSRGGAMACGTGPQGGASGGSGGSGGCGGKGGNGGGYGGSSIGLVSLAANITLREVPITTGKGGRGGAGGHGQFGGRGGLGGLGGAGRGGSKPGCNGGTGGAGGNGGHGSGGIGGHSIGFAFQNGGERHLYPANIFLGAAGTGGPDGNEASAGSHGADGISLSEAAFL